jgi:hypothetical protein
MKTRNEEVQLIAAIEQAVKDGNAPAPSARPRSCDICCDEIAIGGNAVDLTGNHAKTFTVCSGCFEVYRLCPGPRPME